MHLIWKRFLEDDKEAFAEIYNAFVDDLFRYGTKLCQDVELVKDVIQETFLDLYLNRKKNKVQVDHLKFYLILSLKRNLIRKMQKGRKIENRPIVESDLFDTQYSFEEQIIREESDSEVWNKVINAMKQLPPKQKEAIYLRFNQSLEYDEISQMLDISVESVRKQVYRAIKAVRDQLNENELTLFSIFIRHKLDLAISNFSEINSMS
ncbi:RNA polymerase sigma factor [Sunxiuqinia sp. A32]|uniref:RNA polymerase sigma factor n=1 Tax=Sunxiuqinia sp. A32 TaxID=3461496 RepID=UPI004045417F